MERNGASLSETKNRQADKIMDATFKRDLAYRRVRVTHAPSKIFNQEMDGKFLVNKYYSLTGDNIDYFLQLRPHIRIPIGSYVDIKNGDGVFERWLVVADDDRPNFFQYYILKCNWELKWVKDDVVYKCLGVKRTQNSYNSGVWTSYLTTTVENQTKFWMPTTHLTQLVDYDNRMLINDEGRKIPIAWNVTKVEDTSPVGITKLTFAQQVADLDHDCTLLGIASYCKFNGSCSDCPLKEPKYIDAAIQLKKPPVKSEAIVAINGKDNTIRVNGLSKTLSAKFLEDGHELTNITSINWKIELIEKDNVLESVPITIVDGVMSVDGIEDSDGTYRIDRFYNGREILGINIGNDGNKITIRCHKLYSMVGQFLRIYAECDGIGSFIEVEVVS